MKEFSQRDEKWSKIKLGFSKTSTIGKYGCKLVSFSCLAEIRPDVLNERFKKDGCYCGDLLDDNKCAQSLKWKYIGKKFTNPQRNCIAEVDFSPVLGVQQHFVVYNPTKKKILDPWTGTWRDEKTYKFISFRVFSMPKISSKNEPTTKEELKVVPTYQNEIKIANPMSTSTAISEGKTEGTYTTLPGIVENFEPYKFSTPPEYQFTFEEKTFLEKLKEFFGKFLKL